MILHLVICKNIPSELSDQQHPSRFIVKRFFKIEFEVIFARANVQAAIARTTESAILNAAIRGESQDFTHKDGPTFFMKDITLLRNILTAPFRSRLLLMEETQGASSPDHASRRFLLTGVNRRHKVLRQSVPRIRDCRFRLTMLPRCP